MDFSLRRPEAPARRLSGVVCSLSGMAEAAHSYAYLRRSGADPASRRALLH
jgi:hypothetical protein